MQIETERMYMREMTDSDLGDLSLILEDEQVMYAYEHAFLREETIAWLGNQQRRYRENGYGLYAVVLKQSGKMIGQCGLSNQQFADKTVLEIGYLFNKNYWNCGYATEAAIACKNYAFSTLNAVEVFSIIRENNLPSQRVALRNGMSEVGRLVKNYYNIEMPHIVYSVKKAHIFV